VFKSIQLDGNLKPLLINGTYDEVAANDAYLTLYDEYNGAIKSNRNNTTFEKQKQLQILVNQYGIIKACLFLIYQKLEFNVLNSLTQLDKEFKPLTYVDEVLILNNLGFKVDIDNIEKELIRVEKQKENYKTKLAILKKELESEDKGEKDSFNKTIFQAQKFQGFPFNQDAKVIDLVTCLNELIVSNNAQKKTKNNVK
jgi:hypothetical protein